MVKKELLRLLRNPKIFKAMETETGRGPNSLDSLKKFHIIGHSNPPFVKAHFSGSGKLMDIHFDIKVAEKKTTEELENAIKSACEDGENKIHAVINQNVVKELIRISRDPEMQQVRKRPFGEPYYERNI
ncbi:nucleoid-associated protein RHA1 [Acrasis kona]|uniref:Nucleoid-associated protein RHA1 n=1 Tax=Acrasis kona TaxID=1008807 RepID=A0AAW2YU26_9EUKA